MNLPPDDKRCARVKRDGNRCQAWAVRGTTVCSKHGGMAPQVQRAAKRRQDRERAEKAVVRFGLKREIGPHEALLEEVQRAAHYVTECEQVLAEIDHGKLMHGITKTVVLPDGSRRVELTAARSAWLDLLQEERRNLVRAASEAIRCGVAEREVQIREDQARQLARVVAAICEDFGIDLSDRENREKVRLRLLEGGQAAA